MSNTPPDVSRENFRIEASLELEGTLLPSETDLYDLGSDERRFRDLWLAFPTPEHDPVIHIGDETFTGTDVINARNVTRVAMSALQPYDIVFKTGGVNWWKNIEPLGTPTTIAGYNITDAYGITEIQDFFAGNVAIDGYNKFDWDSTRTSVYDTSGNWNIVYNNVQGDDTVIENLKINQQFIVNPTNSNHTITISGGYIHGPNTLYIDPFDNTDQATKEGVTGTVVVLGNLQVEGTTTTINSTEVAIVDKTIELAKGSTTPAQANGAGLTVAGANVNITYNQPADRWEFNKGLKVSGTSNVDGRLYVKSINDDVTGGTLVLKHANNNTTDVVSTIFFENNAGTTSYIQAETVDDNLKGQISFFTRDGTTAKRAVTIDSQQRVGIGTNNPDQILTVGQKVGGDTNQRTSLASFNATDNAYLEIENTTTQKPAGVIFTNVATKKWTIAKEGSGHHLYIRNASDAAVATFLQSGNVGINTVTPVVRLDINGTDAIKIPKGTTAQRPAATTTTQQGYIRYNTTTSQFEGFGAGNSWGSLGGVMDIDQDTYISPETAPGDDDDTLRFFTGGLERTRINDSGYMGVGIITPGARIHADESINGVNAGLLISNYNTTAGTEQQTRLLFGLARNSGSLKSTAGEIRVGKEQDWTNDDAKLDSYMTFNVYENMVSHERVRINSGGNVGIGATDPAYKLDVHGWISAQADALSTDAVINLAGANANNYSAVSRIKSTSDSDTNGSSTLTFSTRDSSNVIDERMRVNTSGVQIGSNTSDSQWIVLSTQYGDFSIGNGSANTPPKKYFSIYDNDANQHRLWVSDSGNIGIGTTSPTRRLTVVDNANDDVATFINDDAVNGYGLNITAGGTAEGRYSLRVANKANNVILLAKADGNVGIGTSNPARPLHVNSGEDNMTARFTSTDTAVTIELEDLTGRGWIEARNDFRFGNNQKELMRINSVGDFGLGTQSPLYPLHIVHTDIDRSRQKLVQIERAFTPVAAGVTQTMYEKSVNIDSRWCNIPVDSTENGYRIALDASCYIADTNFKGYLEQNFGIWARAGAHTNSNDLTNQNPTGTINKSYAVFADCLQSDNVTINHSYGIYQNAGYTDNPDDSKNFFHSRVGIGNDNPEAKLHVQHPTTNSVALFESLDANVNIRFRDNATTNDSYVGAIGNDIVLGNVSGGDHVTVKSSGKVGIGTSSPQAILDVTADSNTSKVTKFGNDITSHYVVTGQEDHTFTFTCGSYYQAEVVITAHQTNGGTSNNLYIRGIWSNNYTSHHWEELENVGGLTTSDFTITNTHNGGNEENGKLVIQHNYSSGSFSRLTVRVTDFFGTHSFNLT